MYEKTVAEWCPLGPIFVCLSKTQFGQKLEQKFVFNFFRRETLNSETV